MSRNGNADIITYGWPDYLLELAAVANLYDSLAHDLDEVFAGLVTMDDCLVPASTMY